MVETTSLTLPSFFSAKKRFQKSSVLKFKSDGPLINFDENVFRNKEAQENYSEL